MKRAAALVLAGLAIVLSLRPAEASRPILAESVRPLDSPAVCRSRLLRNTQSAQIDWRVRSGMGTIASRKAAACVKVGQCEASHIPVRTSGRGFARTIVMLGRLPAVVVV